MANEQVIPEEQMILSIQELKEMGFTHYKINQLVDEGHLRKLNKKYYENLCYRGKNSLSIILRHIPPKGWYVCGVRRHITI